MTNIMHSLSEQYDSIMDSLEIRLMIGRLPLDDLKSNSYVCINETKEIKREKDKELVENLSNRSSKCEDLQYV